MSFRLIGPEAPYLSAIGALMYLANCTHPNIVFLSISYPSTVLLQLEDIRMTSNMYCVIFVGLLIWAYLTKMG